MHIAKHAQISKKKWEGHQVNRFPSFGFEQTESMKKRKKKNFDSHAHSYFFILSDKAHIAAVRFTSATEEQKWNRNFLIDVLGKDAESIPNIVAFPEGPFGEAYVYLWPAPGNGTDIHHWQATPESLEHLHAWIDGNFRNSGSDAVVQIKTDPITWFPKGHFFGFLTPIKMEPKPGSQVYPGHVDIFHEWKRLFSIRKNAAALLIISGLSLGFLFAKLFCSK